MNNAAFGLSLQKLICDQYKLKVNEIADLQFKSNYDPAYEPELKPAVSKIFKKVGSDPSRLVTFTKEFTDGKQTTCPHNFVLKNGKTFSIRTMLTSDKVAPRTVGQAGFAVLNDYFAEIYGKEIETQYDIKKLMIEKIHEVLPIFIDNLFQSDITAFLSHKDLDNINIITSSEVANYTFKREDFSFTRGLDTWVESTTLKFRGKSIAEIQTHKERSFKFRFIVSSIPDWFKVVKETTESLGISAESAVCNIFNLEQPDSFRSRVIPEYVKRITPVLKDAFKNIPDAIKHTGSEQGSRGGASKSPYDFILDGNKTLSLKSNWGKKVCPPDVGQPSSKVCLAYFKNFFPDNLTDITKDQFKEMVFQNIEKIMPIYVEHLFDSDWLMWIYDDKGNFKHREISKDQILDFKWDRSKFSFTKESLDAWNESNTVKYDGKTLGEFQVHNNRNCMKFRFNMPVLLDIILK